MNPNKRKAHKLVVENQGKTTVASTPVVKPVKKEVVSEPVVEETVKVQEPVHTYEELNSLTSSQLKEKLKELNLSAWGTKKILVERLLESYSV